MFVFKNYEEDDEFDGIKCLEDSSPIPLRTPAHTTLRSSYSAADDSRSSFQDSSFRSPSFSFSSSPIDRSVNLSSSKGVRTSLSATARSHDSLRRSGLMMIDLRGDRKKDRNRGFKSFEYEDNQFDEVEVLQLKLGEEEPESPEKSVVTAQDPPAIQDSSFEQKQPFLSVEDEPIFLPSSKELEKASTKVEAVHEAVLDHEEKEEPEEEVLVISSTTIQDTSPPTLLPLVVSKIEEQQPSISLPLPPPLKPAKKPTSLYANHPPVPAFTSDSPLSSRPPSPPSSLEQRESQRILHSNEEEDLVSVRSSLLTPARSFKTEGRSRNGESLRSLLRSQSKDFHMTWMGEKKEVLQRTPKNVHLAAAVRLSRETIQRSALHLADTKTQATMFYSGGQQRDLLQINRAYLADWALGSEKREAWNTEEVRVERAEDNLQDLKLWNTLYSA